MPRNAPRVLLNAGFTYHPTQPPSFSLSEFSLSSFWRFKRVRGAWHSYLGTGCLKSSFCLLTISNAECLFWNGSVRELFANVGWYRHCGVKLACSHQAQAAWRDSGLGFLDSHWKTRDAKPQAQLWGLVCSFVNLFCNFGWLK